MVKWVILSAMAALQLISCHLQVTPYSESIRFKAYSTLRQKMSYLVKTKEGVDSRRGWLKVYERWQQVAKLEEHKIGINRDPLIPSTRLDSVHAILVEELSFLEGMTKEGAIRVANEVIEYSCKLSTMVETAETEITRKLDHTKTFVNVQKLKRRFYNADSDAKVEIKDECIYRLEPSFKYSKVAFSIHDISEDRAIKLYHMWQANRGNKFNLLL